MLLFTGLVFYSCKKENPCDGCINGNKPPVANAGPDQSITLPTDSISLNALASIDPDGTISTWLWKKISGPVSANIVNPAAATIGTIIRDTLFPGTPPFNKTYEM